MPDVGCAIVTLVTHVHPTVPHAWRVTAPARPKRSRMGIALVLGGYVVPVLIAAILLFVLGDIVIGIALLCIELAVSAGIHFSLKQPSPHDRPGRLPGEPVLGLPGDIPRGATNKATAQVAVAMIGIVVLLGVVSVIAAHFG